MPAPLTADQLRDALATLPGWTHEQDTIRKEFEFHSFREAMGFLVRIAFEAEAQDHHPTITNTYSRVSIALNTHDAGGRVTEKDTSLAAAIERISWV